MRFPKASICALAALCALSSVVETAASRRQQRQQRRLAKKRKTENLNGVLVTSDEDGAPALEGRYLFSGEADSGKGKSACPQLKKMGVDECEWYGNVRVGSFVIPRNEGRGSSEREKKFLKKALSPGGVLSGLVENVDADAHVYADWTDFETNTRITGNGGLWGLDYTDGTDDNMHTFERGHDASNIYIVIMDTGILCSHQEFSGSHVSCSKQYVAPGIRDSNGDRNGHGTHCAGTAIGKTTGVAKGLVGANLWSYQVLSHNGRGTSSGVIAALDELYSVAQANPGNHYIASLSLGGSEVSTEDAAANRLANLGNAHVVVAAGNSDRNACNYSPAGAADAITVGSVTYTNDRSSWSNYGSCVDLFAPGSGVYSSWKNSDSSYNTISGTSMACPHVTGAVAVLVAAGMDVDSNLYRSNCGVGDRGSSSPDACVTTAASLATGPSSSSSTTTTTTSGTGSTAATTTTTSGTGSSTTITTMQSTPSGSCDTLNNNKQGCQSNTDCAFVGKGNTGTCVERSTCGPKGTGDPCSGHEECALSCKCKGNGRCA